MSWKKLLTFLAVLLTALFITTSAFAQHISSTPLDSVLGKLSWGMSHENVMKILEKDIMAEFQVKASGSTDLAYADRLRKTYNEMSENMKKSYIQLTSDNSGSMSVSIIGEEFAPDNAESLLIKRETGATKYYFFHQDKLYKIAVVLDSGSIGNISFDRYAGETKEKYGRAFAEGFDDDGFFIESTWKDKKNNCLAIKNKSTSYNTFLSVYYSDDLNKLVEAKHIANREKLSAGPSVSAEIDDLTSGSLSTGNEDSVDAILGSSTEVDLLSGLSEEDLAIVEGRVTAEEAEKQKKKKAAKVEKKPKKDKEKKGIVIY